MKKITVTIIVEAQIPDDAILRESIDKDELIAFTIHGNTYAFWPTVEEQRLNDVCRDLTDKQIEERGILYEIVSHAFEEHA